MGFIYQNSTDALLVFIHNHRRLRHLAATQPGDVVFGKHYRTSISWGRPQTQYAPFVLFRPALHRCTSIHIGVSTKGAIRALRHHHNISKRFIKHFTSQVRCIIFMHAFLVKIGFINFLPDISPVPTFSFELPFSYSNFHSCANLRAKESTL